MTTQHQNKMRFSIIYLTLALVVFLVLHFVVMAPEPLEKSTYSQFLQALEEKRVESVQIRESELLWKPRDSQRWHVTTRIPAMDESELLSQFRESGAEFAGQVSNRVWLPLLSWLLPIVALAALWFIIFNRIGGRQEFLKIGRSGARVYDKGSVDVTFDSVAGVDEAKAELQEVVDVLRNPAKYQALGGKIPKGILLVGPPGTGKTLLAKATAGEAGVPFYSISGSEFVEMFVGVGAARVRDLFEQAKKNAPCIVFVDEIDTIGKRRGTAAVVGGHEEREQTLNQLLTEMDGFDPSQGVIIMAATNRPDVLDPALLRPGRFDRRIEVDRPDMQGREAILKVHTRKVKLAPDVDLKTIAARTPGFVGADLANVVNEAALLAARRGKQAVEMVDFEDAIDRVISGLERRSRIISEKEKEIVSIHEMGHALVALLLPYADPVHKVTIVSRGSAALGMTLQLPLRGKYLYLKEELENKIAVALGGRAAEQLVFGQISTGAHNDLLSAARLARRMVVEFGMSERLGPLALADNTNSYLEQYTDGLYPRQYSEEMARLIDQEVKEIIDRNYSCALKLLEENRQALEILSKELREKETISGSDLKQKFEELRAKLKPSQGVGASEVNRVAS